MSKLSYRVAYGTKQSGGLERTLDTVALVVLVLFCVIAVFGLSLSAAVTGVVSWLLLRSLAEGIRLLKRLNDLPYSGEISHGKEVTSYKCGECGAPVTGLYRCYKCGSIMVGDRKEAEVEPRPVFPTDTDD